MNKILKNKKLMSLMLALMMIVTVFAPSLAQAAVDDSNLAMLTLDSQHFSIVDKVGKNVQIEAKGLTSSYQPTTIDPAKVSWTTSNKNVASITVNPNNKAIATINLKAVGEATITAKYSKTNVTEIKSNVFVESGVNGPAVNNIKISIVDKSGSGETFYSGMLNSVSPKDIGVVDTLKNSSTVYTALKQAPVQGLVFDPNSGYIIEMFGKKAETINGKYYGWQYKVNGVQPKDKAAGVYKLNDGDKIEWFYGEIQF